MTAVEYKAILTAKPDGAVIDPEIHRAFAKARLAEWASILAGLGHDDPDVSCARERVAYWSLKAR